MSLQNFKFVKQVIILFLFEDGTVEIFVVAIVCP